MKSDYTGQNLKLAHAFAVLVLAWALFAAMSSFALAESETGTIDAEDSTELAELFVEQQASDALGSESGLEDPDISVSTGKAVKSAPLKAASLNAAPMKPAGRSYNLSYAEQKIYDALLPRFEEISSGELTNTEFEFSMLELLELEPAADHLYPAEYCRYDIHNIVEAIYTEYPYYLFWSDCSYGCSRSGYTDRGDVFEISDSATIGFTFPVIDKYSVFNESGRHYTDADKIKALSVCAENAAAVVSENAGKSDEEKIRAYCDYICDATEYDYDAAESHTVVSLGNTPHQLTSVFDDDPNTLTVCDGYSKAFQLLCNLTDFDSDEISCIRVTGTTQWGKFGHAWNILHMDDGNNYVADITHSDPPTSDPVLLVGAMPGGSVQEGYKVKHLIGFTYTDYKYDSTTLSVFSEDELLICCSDYGWSDGDTTGCNHVYSDPVYTWSDDYSEITAKRVCKLDSTHVESETVKAEVDSNPATCVSDGYMSSSAEFTNRYFEKQSVRFEYKATGHDYQIDEGSAKEPTCNEDGREAKYICSKCGEGLGGNTIPALGHNEVIQPAKEPTCEEPGCTEGCYCDRCGMVYYSQMEIAPIGHKWGRPEYEWSKDYSTVTARRYCQHDKSHVQEETVKTTSEVTWLPTLSENGETTYTGVFSNPDFTDQEITVENIPKLPSSVNTSAGTVKILSEDDQTAVFVKAKNKSSVTIPASVRISGLTYKITQVNAKAFTGKNIRTVTIGANVKKIAANAFKGSKATKVILKTKLLKKTTVKKAFAGSKVKLVQVKVGSSKVNKKYVKTYKKIFTKNIVGVKVTVK